MFVRIVPTSVLHRRPRGSWFYGGDNYCDAGGLAPDIVEAILEDALPDHLTLFDIAVNPPALWEEQRLILTQRVKSEGDT